VTPGRDAVRVVRLVVLGMRDAFADDKVRGLLGFTLTLILLAATVFWLVEGWPFLDALFFAVATISTVGYGDQVPQTVLGRLFCMVYIMIGLGVFVAAASAVAEALLRRRAEPDALRPARPDDPD
jgi:hypothetical protein